MTYNPKVHVIPAKPPKREKRVGMALYKRSMEWKNRLLEVGFR